MKLQDLAMSLNDWFKCVDGPPKAYFEMQEGRIIREGEIPKQGIPLTLHRYVAVCLAATTCDAEDRILHEVWRRFNTLHKQVGGRSQLVWRAHPEIQVEDEEILGPLWARLEEWEDRGKPTPPAGVIQSAGSMNWFYLEGHRKVTTLWSRLAIVPEPDYTALNPKQQVAPAERI